MTVLQVAFAVISALAALIGIGLTIRNWVYGGSIVRVELELARQDDWGRLVTGTVARWGQGDDKQLLAGFTPSRVDLAKVTVRNLGRTAATVHDVGLRVGRPPTARGSWTAVANRLLPIGETETTVRIEAHDVKVFYFHTMPIIRGARARFVGGPLALRACVMTGIGKTRLSRRWHHFKWNVWVLRGEGDRSIVDEPLTMREQARLWVDLVEEVYEPDFIWVKQVTGEAVRLAEAGEDPDEIAQKIFALGTMISGSGDIDRAHGFMRALADHLVELREAESSVESEA